jgi:hypothetical protein
MHNTRLLHKIIPKGFIVACLTGLICSTGFATGNTDAQHPIKPFTAAYNLRSKGMTIAEIRHQLAYRDSKLVFSTYSKPKGLATWISSIPVVENSVLEWRDDKLLPIEYSRKHTGKQDAKIRDLLVNYNYDKQQAFASLGDETYSFSIEQGLWDNASLILSIMNDLQHGLKELNYRLIDENELKEHHYKVEESGPIDTAIGKLNAVKLARLHGSRETFMWFAPEMDYLLLKIQQFRKGKLKSEMTLQSVTGTDPTK